MYKQIRPIATVQYLAGLGNSAQGKLLSTNFNLHPEQMCCLDSNLGKFKKKPIQSPLQT